MASFEEVAHTSAALQRSVVGSLQSLSATQAFSQ
jgi:hypothetical protein